MTTPDMPNLLDRIITFGGDDLGEVTNKLTDVLQVLDELDAQLPKKKTGGRVRILLVGTGEDIAGALHEIFSASDTAPEEPPITL